MGFICSLLIFYPGPPPVLTVGNLRAFSESVGRCGVTESPHAKTVELGFGGAARAYSEVAGAEDQFDAAEGFCGVTPLHHAAYGRGGNIDLWPDEEHAARGLVRASLEFGGLRLSDPKELTCQDAQHPSCGFALHSLSVSVGPACPDALGMDDEEFACLGFVELRLSGMGYFSWRPMSEQARVVLASPAVISLLDCCRQHFPVPPEPERLRRVGDGLGERFFNRHNYRPGDWIVSFWENG